MCRFDGDLIVEVRAYLDSAMVAYVVGLSGAKISASARAAAQSIRMRTVGSSSLPSNL